MTSFGKAEYEELRRHMREAAMELRFSQSPRRFSILELARREEIEVEIRFDTKREKEEAIIDLDQDSPRITLYRTSDVAGTKLLGTSDERFLTGRERFSIAHEIGHWVALRRFEVEPARQGRDYWLQESLMNAFAGELLAPSHMLSGWLAGVPSGMPVPLDDIRYWARSVFRVSEEVVASQLTGLRSGLGFLKVLFMEQRGEIFKVLFSRASPGLTIPRARSHVKHRVLSRSLGNAGSGERVLSGCDFADGREAVRIAWREAGRLKVSGSSTRWRVFWLSLCVQDKKISEIQRSLPFGEGRGR